MKFVQPPFWLEKGILQKSHIENKERKSLPRSYIYRPHFIEGGYTSLESYLRAFRRSIGEFGEGIDVGLLGEEGYDLESFWRRISSLVFILFSFLFNCEPYYYFFFIIMDVEFIFVMN